MMDKHGGGGGGVWGGGEVEQGEGGCQLAGWVGWWRWW
jgi:hypothetical protein